MKIEFDCFSDGLYKTHNQGVDKFMLQKLNSPYPYTARIPDSLKTILFISWFIFFFVFLFRSEQFVGNRSTPYRLLVSSYYGLATFTIAIINILIFSSIVKPEKEKNWKVWNEILLYIIHFLTISFAIHFLGIYVLEKEVSFFGILYSIFTTTLIGLIPVSLHVINEQRKLFKKYYQLAGEIADESADQKYVPNKGLINFESQSYPISDLLYFESNRNYLNIFMTEERMLSIRLTIKEMENLLAVHPQFIRCHRAYIVNTHRIRNVEGNAQGLKLFLHEISSFVPVSRSYISKVDNVIRPNE